MRKTFTVLRVLAAAQLLLLAFAIVVLLLDDAGNALAWLVLSPFLIMSAILLLGLVIYLALKGRHKPALCLVVANLVTLGIGGTSIFLNGRCYVNYMSRVEHDTIHCQLIPPQVVLPDSIILDTARIIHVNHYHRKHLFSKEFQLVNDDLWNHHNNGWYNYYYLELKQRATRDDKRDISSIDFEIIGVPRDSISWMGCKGEGQQFSYHHHVMPGDTIRLAYRLPSGQRDTILAVKMKR